MTDTHLRTSHRSDNSSGPHKKQTAYEKFTVENKKPWTMFNLFTTLGSIALAVGTFLVVYYQEEDCSGLKTALWMVFIMHIVNAFETILNLVGLEKKLCNNYMVCGFFIFEITVLVYMQVVYFEAMASSYCITRTALMYFWLMGQILVFYFVVVLTVCFFFRKFCQDPRLQQTEANY